MRKYVSNLAPLIKDFIEFKNALGIQYITGAYYLEQLDIYNLMNKNVSVPDKDTVEGWVLTHAEKSITGDRSWISPIREFGRYLQSRGVNEAYVLDNRFIIQRYHAEVYLMTESEINVSLMNVTGMC